MRKALLLLALLAGVVAASAQTLPGLVLNEVSQGPSSSSKEYFEFVVAGTPTCTQTTLDLRGWIFDDNNGWIASGSGQGIAAGCIRFANVANWAAVPYGSIILVYNEKDKATSITMADDPTDANNDKVYVLPASSSLLERNFVDPSVATGSAYPTSGFGQGLSTDNHWGTVALANGGDGVIIVKPTALNTAYFSFGYAIGSAASATVWVPDMPSGKMWYLSDANFNQAASWIQGDVGVNETPGAPNGGANTAWILSMRQPAAGVNAGTVSGGPNVCVGSTATYTTSGTAGGTWSIAPTSVATINALTGVATGVAAGSATVTYTITSGGCTATATAPLTVVAAANAGTISGTTSICQGNTSTLSSNGASGGTWSSSNTAVATVNASTGVVTGVGVGTATITYTVSNATCGNATAQTIVTVTNLAPAAISGNPTICLGGTRTYSNATPGGSWSSSNPAIVSIDPNTGVANGLAVGSSTITYTVTSGSCTGSVSIPVQVTALPSAGTLTVPATLCLGQNSTFTSSVPGGSWAANPASVVSVNGTTGSASAAGVGNATVTYTVTDAAGCTNSASAPVAVVAPPNAGTISGTTALCVGSTSTLTSSGNTGGTWSSNAPAVATVNASSGLVTAVGAGNATITYTVSSASCGPATAQTTVTVTAPPTLQPTTGPSSVCVGATIQLTNPLQPNGAGTWTATPAGLVTLGPTLPTGGPNIVNVTALAPGVVTINFTAGSGSCTSTVPFTLTINAVPAPPAITGNTSLCVGSTSTLANSLGGGTWSSGNTSVATINPTTGVVTGVAPGTNVPITYTVTTNGCTGTANTTVTVNAAPVISPITAPALCAGATTTLTPSPAGGSWTSANTGVATITNAGLLTGVAAGSTQLTYTVSSGGCTASQNVAVTVNAASVVLGASATSINLGQSVTLTPSWTGTAPFTVSGWTPPALFPNQTAATQTVAPTATTTFSVSGSDAHGCTATGSVTVTVAVPQTDDLFVPNYFTPNADGRNDILYFYGSSVATLDFRIFNQWGEQVFASTDKSRGWDGSAGGKQQPVGVYMYVAKATMANGQTRTLKGSVNLIR